MRTFSSLAMTAVASTLALTVLAGEVKTDMPGMGTDRQLIHKDEETTAGSFDGTWLYVNRDMRFGMWIRTKSGVPQVKIQYQSLANPEAFESDWDGKALYYMAGSPVTFELKLGKCTADRIVGAWTWDATVGATMRRETADIALYRSEFGRTVVMDFQNYEKTINDGVRNRLMKAPMVWNWVKISKRESLWDEFPF